MSPVAILERISDALRSTSKLPEVFTMLAEARSKPNGADAWLGVAQAALQNGDPERCKVLLTSWLEQDPHNVAFNVLLSKALQQAGTPEALEKSVSAAR